MKKISWFILLVMGISLYASAFNLDAPSTTGRMQIRFLAGETCTVKCCSSLTGSWSTVTNVVMTGDVVNVDLPMTNGQAFYRLFYETPYPVVSFADASVRDAVRAAVPAKYTPTNWLYTVDVETITALDVRDAAIDDLSGLEQLFGLEDLRLYDNELTSEDLIPLQYLTNLTYLDLGNNSISNINALAELKALETLNLSRNSFTHISVLAGMTNLWNLSLQYNNITNLSPLAGLRNLHRLQVYGNNFTDISPLAGISSLTDLYIAQNTSVTNLELVSEWTRLERLSVGDNGLTNIQFLHTLTNLEALWIDHNDIVDISVLTNFPKLVWLDATSVLATNFAVLVDLPLLEQINLNYTDIDNIDFISGLTNLFRLRLLGNEISDLGAVITNAMQGGLGAGNDLYLTGNPLSDFAKTNQIPTLIDTYGIDVFGP